MIKKDEFSVWLGENTQYSPAVVSDIVSRMKRADSIMEWNDSETYLFYLEKVQAFQQLTMCVKSQIRKAVRLYRSFAVPENK